MLIVHARVYPRASSERPLPEAPMLSEKVCAIAGPTGRSQVLATSIWRIGIDQPLPRARVFYGVSSSCLLSQSSCFPAHIEMVRRSDAMRCDAMPSRPYRDAFLLPLANASSRFFVPALLCSFLADRRRRTTECRGPAVF